MEQYSAIELVNTTLEDSELHLHSFSVIVGEKGLFGYSATGGSYTIHLTDKRLIVEPDVNEKLLENFYSAVQVIPFNGTHYAKTKAKNAKNNMNYMKYTSISLSYDEIETIKFLSGSFKAQFVHISIKSDLDKRHITFFKDLGLEVFKPFPVQQVDLKKIWSEISEKGLKNLSSNLLTNISNIKYIDSTPDFIVRANNLFK
ncbi:hypothetical protein IQ277_27830 [Nostocales cyanobacterium LEGE 12452]|nr:hypothetical protein [Nostocales cyanobacterium LEGE 12452]